MPDYMQALMAVAHPKADQSNIRSISVSLEQYGEQFGLHLPHRYVDYAAQVGHESGGFVYDEELWGPTPAQRRYDTRTDLGNSPERDGDGFLYRGRTGLQATGKHNYGLFYDWCRDFIDGVEVPNFIETPNAILRDPWEGLFPIHYWDTRDLNRYSDTGDIEMLTRRINGGRNGLDDRIDRWERAGSAVLGIGSTPRAIESWQSFAKQKGWYIGNVDGLFGPKTRAAMHTALVELGKKDAKDMPVTQPAPVIVVKGNYRPKKTINEIRELLDELESEL